MCGSPRISMPSSSRTVLAKPSQPTRYWLRTVSLRPVRRSRSVTVTPSGSWTKLSSRVLCRNVTCGNDRACSCRIGSNHVCGHGMPRSGLTVRCGRAASDGMRTRPSSKPCRSVTKTLSSGQSRGNPQLRTLSTMPAWRQNSMVRTLTSSILAGLSLLSRSSTSSVATPRRPRSPASARPIGPPPAISTGVSSVAVRSFMLPSLAERDDLARIENVERIERVLERTHRGKRRLAVLGFQVLHLALADAVLAGAGAIHGERALDQPFQQTFGARNFVGVGEVDHQRQMKITVADMAENRRDEPAVLDIALGLAHAVGEPRNRHTHIGGDRLRAGPQRARRPVCIMARLPQPRTVLGAHRPVERAAAEFLRDLAKAFRLLGDAGIGAVKFDEQNRLLGQRQF